MRSRSGGPETHGNTAGLTSENRDKESCPEQGEAPEPAALSVSLLESRPAARLPANPMPLLTWHHLAGLGECV